MTSTMSINEICKNCIYLRKTKYYWCKCTGDYVRFDYRCPKFERKEDMEDNNLYDVELTYSADGITTGRVYITKEQYEFLKWVADPNNWKNLEKEPYSGDLCVYCEELEERDA